jgi:tetratricopeptide (TPR) repeat protein
MGILAFCTNAKPESLDLIRNETLKEYAYHELEQGAPSLPVVSRLLYREALARLKKGDKEGALQQLDLAARLAPDQASPLFTRARIELLQGKVEALPDAIEGIRRSFAGFRSQAFFATAAASLFVVSLAGAIFATLVALFIKYRSFVGHRITELYSRRFAAPPARWIIPLICVALLLMRLGTALYIAVLAVALWSYLARKEKAIILAGIVVLAGASIAAPYSNCFAPAIDPDSATRRLSIVNQRSASEESIRLIREIDPDSFAAEKNFAIGTMMNRLGLYDAARQYFLWTVSTRPDFAPAFVNLGNVYFMDGDYDKALAGYQSAVALDSTSAVAHYNIGQTYIKKMLFAQSGIWLEKANTLGIEAYRSAHPAIGLRNPPIYEEDFRPRELWAIAQAEGRAKTNDLLGEIVRPFLLFPFRWLWVLLASSLIGAALLSRTLPEGWRIARCDNCGTATCRQCENTATGIRLCPECGAVIEGLSSIKVMEALLRNKRQKSAAPRRDALRWIIGLFPGVSPTCGGKTAYGFILSFIASGAIATIAWGGSRFKDPLSGVASSLPWPLILPCAALAVTWACSSRSKKQQEQRNYHVFPAEMRMQEHEKEQRKNDQSADPWEEDLPVTTPEKKRPAPQAADPDRVFIGDIEKGSKWH